MARHGAKKNTATDFQRFISFFFFFEGKRRRNTKNIMYFKSAIYISNKYTLKHWTTLNTPLRIHLVLRSFNVFHKNPFNEIKIFVEQKKLKVNAPVRCNIKRIPFNEICSWAYIWSCVANDNLPEDLLKIICPVIRRNTEAFILQISC